MGNITTLAVTEQDYRAIINVLEHGYVHNGVTHRPNYRVAFALKLEYATGMRISDIVRLRMKDIVKDGEKYRLDIKEKKTGKKRTFRINQQIYNCIDDYCIKHGIPSNKEIIGICEYAVQKQLKFVCDYIGLERVGTHSFRKSCAQRFYALTDFDVVAVQKLLQHRSASTTYTYLNSGNKVFESALDKLAM